MRDGLEIWSGLALRHTDRYEVLPYREYEYVLKVGLYLWLTFDRYLFADILSLCINLVSCL